MEKTNACLGNCCNNFTLPYSPTEFDRMLKALQEGKEEFVLDSGRISYVANTKDLENIVDMIVFKRVTGIDPASKKRLFRLTKSEMNQSNLQKWLDRYGFKLLPSGQVQQHVYTCRHWSKETKLCTNYENRPELCKHHGVGNDCKYIGCTMKCDPPKN